MECNYRYCNEEIPSDKNGNSRYCDNDCYAAEKLERSKEQYAITKKSLNEIKRVESVLRSCFKMYGNYIFEVSVLRNLDMIWNIFTHTKRIDGNEVFFVGSFGYLLFDNNTIKLYKL